MSALESLKPLRKFLVMNLLAEAGFEVDHWKDYRGEHPAANPKYCYNWSFEQPGETIAVCLWYRSLKERNGTIVYDRKPRAFASTRKERAASVWNRRDSDFGNNLEIAYRQQLPVRVIVLEGKQRTRDDPRASTVSRRLLDPVAWAIERYNYDRRMFARKGKSAHRGARGLPRLTAGLV
jgi:5-methylcytosine-specific restriction protein A